MVGIVKITFFLPHSGSERADETRARADDVMMMSSVEIKAPGNRDNCVTVPRRFHGRFHGGSTASQTDPP